MKLSPPPLLTGTFSISGLSREDSPWERHRCHLLLELPLCLMTFCPWGRWMLVGQGWERGGAGLGMGVRLLDC